MISISQFLIFALPAYILWKIIQKTGQRSALSTIPGPPNTSWLKGNVEALFDRHGWVIHRNLALQYGGVAKIYEPMGTEGLYVMDPLALHHIVVKDQDIYHENSFVVASNDLVFGKCLIVVHGDHHRKQRKILTPAFAPKQIRGLAPTFKSIAQQLSDVIERKVRTGDVDIDIHLWMSRAALDYIGQAGLGYSFDSLNETKSNEYDDAVKHIIGSPAFRRKLLDWTPWTPLQQLKEITDVMDKQSRTILEQKKEALRKGDDFTKNQVGEGKDIMSVLLKANMSLDDANRLPESEVLGQMNLLIFAAHDTTTNALSRILHQLALNPNIQYRLRDELIGARKEHGDLEYDTLMGLPFLDAVCRETLRVFPPVSILMRTLTKDATLPLLFPIKAADARTEIKEIPLENGTNIIISILNANRSKAIWGEDAEDWKPDRWLQPLPESVSTAHLPSVYSQMMTFLGGNRSCIGIKFSELEMKVVLLTLLTRFRFTPGSEEIYWNMSSIAYPGVKGSDAPGLPIKVELLESHEAG